ncbi:MerR family transcriptional regulator [Lacticaseibacillus baoqingensis]|uniref:MerR family transcriptional regulator n=1 Tax=Lacticaseibacillus baoqingensis TaxID=2486013 RepID=A0ABW4EAE2_9LACO|nr:MerR family transcriptional regulator [Lacticaseibacillus baoqingensis]
MTYTIKEVAEKTGLSVYTLRFYDKSGLLPFVARYASDYLEFTDGDLQLLHPVCCLKNTEKKIADIRTCIGYVMQGPGTIKQRQTLLAKHREKVVAKQTQLAQNLQEIDYKLNMYRSPDAITRVKDERRPAKADKRQAGLADGSC